MTSPAEATDALGQKIVVGNLAIITVDERFSLGFVEDIYETTGRYSYRGRKTIKVRRVKFTGSTVSKAATGMLQDYRKIVMVENFNFLPTELIIEVKKNLGLTS